MSFAPPLTIPVLTREVLRAANEQWASLAKELRRPHAVWRERVFMRCLTTAENTLLSAVASRTLGWTKLLEVIPLQQFIGGLKDQNGEWVLSEGLPAFLGTGLDRKTISKALAGLEHKGMLSRFVFPHGGRETYAYMPISVNVLGRLLEARAHLEPMPAAIAALLRVDPGTDEMVSTNLERAFAAACNDDIEMAAGWLL